MKKKMSILLVLVLVLSLVAGCGGEQGKETDTDGKGDDEVIVMKLANTNPPGDIRDEVCLKFAELVDEKTNGKVEIEVYSGGTLGDWRDALEGLGMGINEIVIEAPSTLVAFTDLAGIDALPYLYKDKDHWLRVMMGDVGKELLDAIGDEGGFKLLAPQYRGARITTSKKPIESIDDVQGLKIRVPNNPYNIEQWKYLGAAPTPLALTETFTALQQGTVEAQENPVIESYGFAFYDVCDYLVLTNHVFNADTFIFDKEYFGNLDQDLQTAIEDAAYEAANWRNEEAIKTEEEYIGKFEEEGATVMRPDLDPFREKVKDFVGNEYPDLAEWVEKIQGVN